MGALNQILSGLVVALSATSVTALAHDKVQAFPEAVPDKYGSLYKKYHPFLEVASGCVPYPAVQANGEVR